MVFQWWLECALGVFEFWSAVRVMNSVLVGSLCTGVGCLTVVRKGVLFRVLGRLGLCVRCGTGKGLG